MSFAERDWQVTIGVDPDSDEVGEDSEDYRYRLRLDGSLVTHVRAARFGGPLEMTLAPDQIVEVLKDPDLAALQPVVWPEVAREFLTEWLSVNWPDRYERLLGFDSVVLDRDVERAMVVKQQPPRWTIAGSLRPTGSLRSLRSPYALVTLALGGVILARTQLALRPLSWVPIILGSVLVLLAAVDVWAIRRHRRTQQRIDIMRREYLDGDDEAA